MHCAKTCSQSNAAHDTALKKSKKTPTRTRIDEAKLKQEREEILGHLYNIMNTTRHTKRNTKRTGNAVHYRISDPLRKAYYWLDTQDYDVNYRGRKCSSFCPPKHHKYTPQLHKEKTNGFYHEHRTPKDQLFREERVIRSKRKRKRKESLKRKGERKEKFSQLEEMFESECEFEYYENWMDENCPPEIFALCAENAPEEMQDMVDFLLELQDRDITPEDYEFLLRLDDSVPTKTISKERIASLVTDTAVEIHIEDLCGICMEYYAVGQTRKILPCDHVFHSHCIDTWLSDRSTKCPLDNMDV